MKKRKTKCSSIQKKEIKKLEKVDLDRNFKCLLTISKLKNKMEYMINRHWKKFLAKKEVYQRVKGSWKLLMILR